MAHNRTGYSLLKHSHAGGCAAKLGKSDLDLVLHGLPNTGAVSGDVLVGIETSDDASVYRINQNLAMVTTVDFFPPMVDDPFTFGQIAAANALSDIYAMGADPKVALNLVAFPVGSIPLDVLRAILCGGADKAAAGGVAVTGGHSIIDRELKYGMTVSGFVHPDRILRNIGLRQGDALILTKPLGTGIAVTGVAKGVATDETAESALRTMTSLNRDAAMVLRNFEVHACCDVTGFGLLGHAAEMALGSKVTIALYSQALPVIPGVGDLIARRCVTSGCRRNMEYVRGKVNLDHLDERMVELLLDPQTSGGLLFGLPARSLDAVITQLKDQGVEAAAVIGEVEKAGKLPLRAI